GAEDIELEKTLAPAEPAKEGGGPSIDVLRTELVSPLRSLLAMPPAYYDARNVLPTLLPLSQDSPAFGISRPDSSLRVLTSQDRNQSVWSFRMTSPSAVGKLQAEAEFAFWPFDPYVTSGFGESRFDAYRLEMRGSQKEFSYGANYASVRKAFTSLLSMKNRLDADREGPKVWATWSPGRVGLSVFVRSLHDNLDLDRNKPRFTTTEAGASLTYMLSAWPYLGYTVSYSEGERKSSREPVDYKPYKGPVSTVENSLSYSSERIDIALYTSYSRQRDTLQPVERNADMLSYYASATFRPTKTLSVTPEISYGIDRYPGSASETHRRSTSVALDYWPSKNLGYRAFGSYYAEKNQAWGMDTKCVYTELGIVRALHVTARGGGTLSLSVGHQRYLDAVPSTTNSNEFTLWLMLKTPLLPSANPVSQSDS
ncbi:MAG: hypothetical protein ACM3ON_08360, partial [Chloroflexota bacterium]